jgi:membrane-associated phospholipid phosphatase
MKILSRPFVILLLAALFVVAGWFGGPRDPLEVRVMAWLAEARSEWPAMSVAVTIVTDSGSAPMTMGAAAFGSLYLLLRRSPAAALLLAVTVIAERFLVDGLKLWIGRVRPPIDPAHAISSMAFPSGHAANSLAAFLAVALIAVPVPHRWSATVAALILGLSIGLSRIILGVHWPSDVLGGWALALLSVSAALAIGRRSGAISLEPQHDVIGRHRLPPSEDQPA